jgi:transcriptional regulator with XRE-family HTH domain
MVAQKSADFGQLFRRHRKAAGKTLRAFCRENGYDPSNISKLERGKLPPPKGEKLDEYAEALGIERGSDEWYEFRDVAATSAGRIPERLLSDEEVIKKLPVVFNTLGGEKPSEEQIKSLIDLLRET